MLNKTSYKKIASYSRWFEDFDSHTSFLVGVIVDDKSRIPQAVNHGSLRKLDEPTIPYEDNYIVGEVRSINLPSLDNDENVVTWSIVRKTGPVEFTDDQIWEAFLQHQSEFRPMHAPITDTREEYRKNDPIGYDETMAGFERVLYRALGYL